jgi:hypothetical protein
VIITRARVRAGKGSPHAIRMLNQCMPPPPYIVQGRTGCVICVVCVVEVELVCSLVLVVWQPDRSNKHANKVMMIFMTQL